MSDVEVARVALVDDDRDVRGSLRQSLALAGYAVDEFGDGAAALSAIDENYPGVVVSDVRMPGMSGIELFRSLNALDAQLPVVLMTGHGDIAMAVDALKSGAWDFLTKPFDPETLLAAVTRAAETRRLVLENRRLRALSEEGGSSALIGRSPQMNRLRQTIEVLADADIDVLVEGETGTGKELVARLIHRGGKRSRHRFTTLPCATFTDRMVDESTFGPNGLVASAHRGTLYLDDLDQAPPMLQALLSSLLEERVLPATHSDRTQVLDLRVIGSIDDSERARETVDAALLHRLAAVRLRIPPLRERREDVPLLFAHCLAEAASRLRQDVPDVSGTIMARLDGHGWPGNVRELAHFANRVVLGIENNGQSHMGGAQSLPERMEDFERGAITQAIQDSGGDIGAAIEALGLPRKTFYYRAKRLGIDIKRQRQLAKDT